ncbi:MAG TPA: branched-chain amino acid ABC transporter permease [Burkholderiaceae bacterium]|nr:branched-chain amino acid ABC transporter permease [Burkholderiaceae bacterium]
MSTSSMTPDRKSLGYIALFVGLLILPALGVYPVFMAKVLCFALFACAFNLLIGYTGLLSFGHAAFFGGAAYVAGHAMKVWAWPTPLGLALGALTGAVIGLLFGWLAIRRSGIYFSMITLALAQMLYFFFLQAPFTGGEDGLQSVPRGSFFGISLQDDLTLYFVIVGIVAAAFWLIHRTVHSPFGQVLKAIRENEPRAISLGYDVDRFKLLAFVLSAALTGLAGAMKTTLLGFATLTDAIWTMSGAVILMTLVGGMGTMTGPILGAAVIVLLENKVGDFGRWLADLTGINWFLALGESVTIVTGLIFVVCVLMFRRGIVGECAVMLDRLTARRSTVR